MSELPQRPTSRRAFVQQMTLGACAIMVSGAWQFPFASNEKALIDGVGEACRRLAPLGWRQMLLDVTGGGLDIAAADLAQQLAKPLRIDRGHPGFGDFNLAGTRGIEAGAPDRSLLYHAFASPGVWGNRAQQSSIALDPGDIEEALGAASAIGDDRLQQQTQGRVVPDSFTHGTSEQRVRWFRRGFDSGDPNRCDTFSGSE